MPVLAISYGVSGAGIGFALVGLSSLVAIYLASKYIDVDYIQSVGKPFLAAVIMGILVFIVKIFIPVSLSQLVAMIIVGLITYSLVILSIEPSLIKTIKSQIKPNENA